MTALLMTLGGMSGISMDYINLPCHQDSIHEPYPLRPARS